MVVRLLTFLCSTFHMSHQAAPTTQMTRTRARRMVRTATSPS